MRNNKATQSSGLNGAGSVLAYSSRDSTRIVKHTFDAAKIDIISESCKYFSDYFKFFRVKPTIFDKEVRGTGLGYDGCYDSGIVPLYQLFLCIYPK